MSDNTTLLEVDELTVHYPVRNGVVKAVDGVSFSIQPGETVGLVGESGCGKSTIGRTIIGINSPTSGSIRFAGERLELLKGPERRRVAKRIQIVFQDPFASLDPRMTVGRIISEPLRVDAGRSTSSKVRERVLELIELVGLNPEHVDRYPHEFSGGQRQRIAIARALAPGPDLIICDEAISALDVSIQAQIINLLDHLQETLGPAYLFIAHDLSVVRHISDRIVVMYLGKVMEAAAGDELYATPTHPYTQALLSAVPIPDPQLERARNPVVLVGDVPNPSDPPSGCVFRTRCPIAMPVCAQRVPVTKTTGNGHVVACHAV